MPISRGERKVENLRFWIIDNEDLASEIWSERKFTRHDLVLNIDENDLRKGPGLWEAMYRIGSTAAAAGPAPGTTYVVDSSSTNTSQDPGQNTIRINNASLASATLMTISDVDDQSVDQSTLNSLVGGVLVLRNVDDGVTCAVRITGTERPGAYSRYTIEHLKGSFPADGEQVVVLFFPEIGKQDRLRQQVVLNDQAVSMDATDDTYIAEGSDHSYIYDPGNLAAGQPLTLINRCTGNYNLYFYPDNNVDGDGGPLVVPPGYATQLEGRGNGVWHKTGKISPVKVWNALLYWNSGEPYATVLGDNTIGDIAVSGSVEYQLSLVLSAAFPAGKTLVICGAVQSDTQGDVEIASGIRISTGQVDIVSENSYQINGCPVKIEVYP